MNTKWSVLRAAAVGALLAASSFAATDRVRVFTTRPDLFEYMFASVAAGSETPTPMLSFNNLRTGRTTFAKVGEKVGDYTVTSFEPRTYKAISERTGKEETRKTGKAVLTDAAGRKLTLDMGQGLQAEGFVAWVVDLDTGSGAQARPGDTVTLGGVTQRVDSISLDDVRVTVDGVPGRLGFATDPERAQLSALWAKQREAWEEAKRRSDERAKKDAEAREQEALAAAFIAAASQGAQSSRPVVKPAQTQLSVVTEYRYPTEYEVIPPIYDSRGNMIRPLVVIPRNFVTRPVGMTFGSGTTTPVVQDSRTTGGDTTTVSTPK